MPYCGHCGRELSAKAIACPQCGHPGPASAKQAQARRVDGFAIAAFACGCAGFFPLPVVGSVLGVIFGRIAKRRLAKDPARDGRGLVKGAFIASGATFALLLSVILYAVVAGNGNGGG